jgi:hypothetical protein
MKKINILFFIIITSIIVWIGCGKSPSEPPEVVGGFEIFVYLDSAWVDTGGIEHDSCLAPNFDCIIDDGAPIHSDTVPAIFENLMPGVHNLYLSYNDYNTTIIDTVTAGAIKTLEPKLSKLAPDFDLPGLHYNTSTSAVIYDSVHLSDCAGKVVVIFFFGAS